MTTIGDDAFYDCDRLRTVIIGNSVTHIGSGAFAYCYSIKGITFKNTSGWWCTSSSNETDVIGIFSTDLTDPVTAAKYLIVTYKDYYWDRTE